MGRVARIEVTMATTPFLTLGETWGAQLKPAIPKPKSYELHGKLAPSKTYPAGQALCWDAANNRWDKPDAAGVGPRRRLSRYECTTDASGNASLGTTSRADDSKFESMPMYVGGSFFVKDLVDVPDDAALAELGSLTQGEDAADTSAIVTLHGS